MKFKRCTALIVAFFVFSIMTLSSVAATFPDILERHSWAAEHIEDMVKRGLLKGYTDGTFKPDNPISKLEAVILAARILGVTYQENDEFAEAALAAYEDELAAFDIQYKKEAAYLLYRGCIRISELPSYIGDTVKNTAMNRHEVAKLLTKVMGGETEAQSNPIVILDYADDGEIPAASKPYVRFITDKGIMKGMEDNKFMPMYNVTRAMMATMMYRTEEAMSISTIDAAVLSVNGDSISVAANGVSSNIQIGDNVIIRIDGLSAPLSAIEKGYNLHIHYQEKEIRFIEALSSRTLEEVSGVIKTLSNNAGIKAVTITPNGAQSDGTQSYTLSDNCVIIIDNIETTFSALKYDTFVQMNLQNNKVVRITAETKDYTKSGTIKDMDFEGSTPIIGITTKDGSIEKFPVSVDVAITRNSIPDELRNLAIGDNATLSISSGLVKKITATSVNKDIEGTIEEIIISAEPSITIKRGGALTKYKVAGDTAFYVEDAEGTIYDMRLGATASLTLKSENIGKITISKTTIPSQIIGTVTSINPLYNVLVLDVKNPDTGKITNETVVVRNNVKIVDNTASKVTTFKGIEPGRTIIALGGIDNYGTYSVNTIIITE
ncbi:MAG: S-layer homology domain-containing protein [Firmicutes bacterium]|nr:S-layer homology domain-containing protein [Bacillota bacterium]